MNRTRQDSPTGIERWRDRAALVTGASSGIGAAIAAALGGMGMKVALVGRDHAQLQATAVTVRARGGEAFIVRCDLRNTAARERMYTRVLRHWGGVDVLVNCAAMRGGHSLLATDWSEISDAIELNIGAVLWCTRAFVANLPRGREGAVINISSLIAHRVTPGAPAVYAATKGALRVLSDGLRAEIVARKLPIKVAMVSPGLVDTPWHHDGEGARAKAKVQLPHAALQPDDVAHALHYILSAPPAVQVCDVLLRSAGQGY